MTNDVVIRAEGLSKKYVIGHEAVRERYVALRDVIARTAKGFARSTMDMVRGHAIVAGDTTEEFWALKDVNFEVKRGEVIGIIGRNGAGKSTLLKILSRITEPTEGRVTIEGRVASLLEVGTGFHPELTGRENIYLNGAILGMSRAEIARKFDAIIAFAEVETFLDTPVKRYSSGMYVRLAFAVAAHLETEILIVDEVLAVGDCEFQKKCLGKMDESAKGGRTVLFVSHDMRRVSTLCQRGILLDNGKIEQDGNMSVIANEYLMRRVETATSADLTQRIDHSGSGDAQFQSLELLKDGKRCRTFTFGETFTQRLTVRVKNPIGTALVSSAIRSNDGVVVHELMNVDADCPWFADVGDYIFELTVDELPLYPGTYSIDLWLGDKTMARVDCIDEAITFSVAPSSNAGFGIDGRVGLVAFGARWQIEQQPVSDQPRRRRLPLAGVTAGAPVKHPGLA